MTKQQIEFLKTIYEEPKTAKQICKELGIEGSKNDAQGGYYNALNDYIDYFTSKELEDLFEIIPCMTSISDNDTYAITTKGKSILSIKLSGEDRL